MDVEPNVPAELNAGQGLKATVDVKRRGAMLVLNYKTVDSQGNAWDQAANRDVKPSFTVYKDDSKLLSADFQYG